VEGADKMSKEKFIEDWLALSDIDKAEFINVCNNVCEAVKSAQIALFGAVREVNEAAEKLNTANFTMSEAIKESDSQPKGDF
jgi:hypothetical protein